MQFPEYKQKTALIVSEDCRSLLMYYENKLFCAKVKKNSQIFLQGFFSDKLQICDILTIKHSQTEMASVEIDC